MVANPNHYRVALVRHIWSYFYLAPSQATVLQQVRSSIHNDVGLLRLFEDYETDLLTIDDRLWLQRIALEPYYMGSATDKTVLS